MTEFAETQLPGLGVRYTTQLRSGRSVAVVVHHTGRRDLVVYDTDDPDAAIATVELTEDEGHSLGELLGGSRIVERLDELTHQLQGMVIDWVRITRRSPVADQTLREAGVRARTGASVVALIRGASTIPAPGGDDHLAPGATAVVVGTAPAIAATRALFQGPDVADLEP